MGWAITPSALPGDLGVVASGLAVPDVQSQARKKIVAVRLIEAVLAPIGYGLGRAATFDPPFPNHSIMHGAGRMGLTSLTNLDQVPEAGAVVIALPLKIEGGSGSPMRAVALVEG